MHGMLRSLKVYLLIFIFISGPSYTLHSDNAATAHQMHTKDITLRYITLELFRVASVQNC